MCFNPRTRTGCDHRLRFRQRVFNVSIHAPARGATLKPDEFDLMAKFQSTHPHGVRRYRRGSGNRGRTGFNPRTRTGCDAHNNDNTDYQSVSIHAPARGATISADTVPVTVIGFNPRTRTGCDLRVDVLKTYERGFNPRTRTGCDTSDPATEIGDFVSIHTPTKDVTLD